MGQPCQYGRAEEDTTCAEAELQQHGATPDVAFDMHGIVTQMQKYLLRTWPVIVLMHDSKSLVDT
jgi:hypothetical protein